MASEENPQKDVPAAAASIDPSAPRAVIKQLCAALRPLRRNVAGDAFFASASASAVFLTPATKAEIEAANAAIGAADEVLAGPDPSA